MPWKVPDIIIHRMMLDFDAEAAMPWHIADFKIDKLIWPLVKGNEIVCVVDTGVSQNHFNNGQLRGQVIGVEDFTGSQYGPWDSNGHGSHVTGMIAALDLGIAKNCCKVLSAKCLGDDGSGSDEGIAAGIDWGISKGAKLFNLSLGSDFPSPKIDAAVQRAIASGAWVVFAAGNSSGPVEYPAKNFGGVSALTRERSLATFSCFGAEVYSCAPGVQITSLSRGGGYAVLSGTSMAAPWVTAMLACKRALDKQRGETPPRTKAEWLAWLSEDSDDLGTPGKDMQFGVGVLNASKFAEVPLPPPVVIPPSPPTLPIPEPLGAIGIAVTTDGKNWFRVPTGTKFTPITVSS